jgi:DNA repair exonuclease SbcCD nuclease subunit
MSKKLLFLADLHLTPVPPAARTDDYIVTAFNKLEQVLVLIEKLKVDGLIILGDVFHLKSWTKNPYWLTNRFIIWLRRVDALGCQIGIVIGNHDVPYGNIEFAEKQPIGAVLLQSFMKRDMVFDDPKIHVVMHDFDPNFIKEDLLKYERRGEKFLIVCAHQNFMEHGQLPKEPTINFKEIDADIDVLAFGHIHTPTVISKVNKTLWINPGAMMRGTLHRDNLNRGVSVILLKLDENIQFKQINLDIAPASQVFDLVKKAEHDNRDDQIEEFVEMLGNTSANPLSSNPATILNEMDVDEPVKNIARQYLSGDCLDIDNIRADN